MTSKTQDTSENESESSSSGEDKADSRQPKRKKMQWKKKKLNQGLEKTVAEMDVALDCLESSDTLLRVLQCQKPMIHVLKPTLLKFT